MTARNVHNEALVSKRMMRKLSAQAHKLSISHLVQVHQLLIMAVTTKYVDDDILRASARGIYITLRNSNDNNNGNNARNVDNKAPWAKAWNFHIALRNGNHDSKNWQR